MIALRASRGSDGRHEGLVLWAGLVAADVTVVLSAAVPTTRHSRQYVFIDEIQVAHAARAARAVHNGIVAQVHSHPGTGVRHSDGDDELILMPFEGMFSVVVGRYGDEPIARAGIHQFQNGRWCEITNPDYALVVVPAVCT